jgi:hypothetical protein
MLKSAPYGANKKPLTILFRKWLFFSHHSNLLSNKTIEAFSNLYRLSDILPEAYINHLLKNEEPIFNEQLTMGQ